MKYRITHTTKYAYSEAVPVCQNKLHLLPRATAHQRCENYQLLVLPEPTMVDMKSLSERDICTKYITPSIIAAGWDLHSQLREEVYFTKGQIQVQGSRVTRPSSCRRQLNERAIPCEQG